MENISHIEPFESMLPWNLIPPDFNQKKKQKKRFAADTGRRFSNLSQLVEDTHLNLVEKESPFRLCVYQKKEEIFMDIVTLDKAKKINQLYNRTITNSDMGNLTRQIHSGMGLILDYSV